VKISLLYYKIKTYIYNILGEKNFELINHAKNYMSAEFITKGLAFLSIPLFTRLLTTDGYGILSIYTSVISIFTILLGLNIIGSVSRYFYEENNEFEFFLGSNLLFILIFDILFIIVLYQFKDYISDFFGISSYLFILSIVISFFNVPMKMILAYFQASKKSKKHAAMTIAKKILVLIISLVLIYFLDNNKYLGKAYAEIFVMGIVFLISIYYLLKKSKKIFKLKYISYSLKFGIPLIPHALSGFVLTSFDTIIINQLTGASNAGLYSFAYNIGRIMNFTVIAMNKAWVPLFYEKFKKRNYSEIKTLAYNYSNYIYMFAILLILFSKEIVMIMADKSYYSSLNLVPIIIISYVFGFLYTLYANYSFYFKKTKLISLITIIVGTINVVLNYIYIPKFGYKVASVTTLICNALLFIFHYLNVRFVMKKELINLKKILPNFAIVWIIGSFQLLILNNIDSYIISFSIKLVIVFVMIYYFKNRIEK